MTSLSDRLSVVRPQWDAQVDAFHTLASRAIDSAEQLFALNLKTSRASMEQVNGTLQQLLHTTDPRALFALGSQVQAPWQHMMSYSRELMGIALGARQGAVPIPFLAAPLQLAAPQARIASADTTPPPPVDSDAALAEDTMGVGDQSGVPAIAPADAPADVPTGAPTELDAEKAGEAPSEQPAPAPQQAKPASAAAAPVSLAPVNEAADVVAADIVAADDALHAKAKPLVEAMNELVAMPAGGEHPVAASVAPDAGDVAMPLVTPLDATPPVQLSSGPTAAERRRASRKKS
jgi:phasin family protein